MPTHSAHAHAHAVHAEVAERAGLPWPSCRHFEGLAGTYQPKSARASCNQTGTEVPAGLVDNWCQPPPQAAGKLPPKIWREFPAPKLVPRHQKGGLWLAMAPAPHPNGGGNSQSKIWREFPAPKLVPRHQKGRDSAGNGASHAPEGVGSSRQCRTLPGHLSKDRCGGCHIPCRTRR